VVIDVREHPFAHTVFVGVAPSTKPWIQGRDDGVRCGADVRSSPHPNVRQERVSLLFLGEGRAVSCALAEMEAKKIDSRAHMGDVGFLRVQFSPSFRSPRFSNRDDRFDVLAGAGRHEDGIGVPDTTISIRPFLADFVATLGLEVGVDLLLAVGRQPCLETVECAVGS